MWLIFSLKSSKNHGGSIPKFYWGKNYPKKWEVFSVLTWVWFIIFFVSLNFSKCSWNYFEWPLLSLDIPFQNYWSSQTKSYLQRGLQGYFKCFLLTILQGKNVRNSLSKYFAVSMPRLHKHRTFETIYLNLKKLKLKKNQDLGIFFVLQDIKKYIINCDKK